MGQRQFLLGFPVPMALKLDFMRACERLRLGIERHGLRVEEVDNLTVARKILDQIGANTSDTKADGPYATRWLDPLKSPVAGGNSFWLFAFDQENQPVAKIAARMDPLGPESFRDYAERTLYALYPSDPGPIPPERFPACTEGITGNVGYVGDLYVPQRYGGHGVAQALCQLTYMLMYSRWSIDFIVTYVWESETRRTWIRAPWRVEHNTVSFSHPPSTGPMNIAMVWVDRLGFRQVIADAQREQISGTQARRDLGAISGDPDLARQLAQ